jgi:4-aminobutyrate aminotransferase
MAQLIQSESREDVQPSLEDGTALPAMVASPPGPESRRLAERLSHVEPPTSSLIASGEIPIFWERSRGANVVDADGNVYIDLTAGFCVAVAGHSNPRIVRAISQQAETLLHTQGGLNPNRRRVELSEKLAELAPGKLSVSHIANTGAEAVEMALKTARICTGRQTVIAFYGGFHGKTTGALSVTSQNFYRRPFLSTLPGVVHVPYAYAYRCPTHQADGDCAICSGRYLEYVLETPDSGVADVAAIILEPIQGHGGWIVPPPAFVQAVRRLCDKHGILMIADEIITGFGRTGRWFAMEHYDVVPDILAVGKGLASGFPISATITTPEIASAWKPMQHTSTFLGNPVGCAAALASLAEIEERGLVQRSAELGAYFKAQVEKLQQAHPLIGDVRGLGMMVGIEVVRDRATREPAPKEGARVVEAAMRRGVMANNYGGMYHNVIKMSPPLVITRRQLDVALNALDESFSEVEASL